MLHNLKDKNLSAYNYTQVVAPELHKVCKPLFDCTNLTVCAYIRFYYDGKMFHISTNKEWEGIFFDNQFYNEQDCFHSIRRETVSGGYKKFILTGEPKGSHCSALYDFNIWNTLSIYQKQKNYIEGWAFGTDRNNDQILDLYLNKVAFLKKFIIYFNQCTQGVIDIRDKDQLIQTEHNLIFEQQKEVNKDVRSLRALLNKINHDKVLLRLPEKNVLLSKRETECLVLLCRGKTVKGIGQVLDISPRTVESYINKIKAKTGCAYKSDIISLCNNYLNFWNEDNILTDDLV
jgi:DNA-binding CsgD family transcriptional regulator